MEIPQMYFDTRQSYNFSDWLRSTLRQKQMSVAKLSNISGVHQNTIHNYLADRCEPSLYNVLCVVTALGYELVVKPRDNQ
jgi:DNA-binding phage protein